MAGTTTDKLQKLKDTKAAFYKVITDKGQSITDEPFSEWPAKVSNIETGIMLPILTSPGNSADLRKGKQLIDQSGAVVDGAMVETEQATPSISVSSDGLITATAGDKSATEQLPTMSGRVMTPSDSEQLAVETGVYTTGPIYVQGDGSLRPENIISGVSIFGVAGTLEANSNKLVNFSASDVSVTLDSLGHSQIKLSDSSITVPARIFSIDFGAAIEKRTACTYMARTSSATHVDYNASTTHRFYCEFSGEEGSVVPIVENGALVLHFVDFGGFYNSLADADLLDAADWEYFDCRFVFTNEN